MLSWVFALSLIGFDYAHPILKTEVSSAEVEAHISAHLHQIAPFEFIRKVAEQMKVKAFLFGGTAAGLGYYAADDLRRIKGDDRFQKDKFDFDYSSIYRSTQDADIVIDGTAEQAEALEKIIRDHQSVLLGYKTKWEVRTLRSPRGSKAPLLEDFQFTNQHTDSASVGLIELTTPPPGHGRVLDLRFWGQKDNPFLRGLAAGNIFFYFGNRHDETFMAKHGLNPPIVAVIRYLSKVAQYRLQIDEKDRELLIRMIAEFDPRKSLGSNYARKRVVEFGLKCFQNASDVLFAWKVLEDLGLRKKLLELSDPELAYWLDRKPLPSLDVGLGTGATAEELSIVEVAHTTREFKHYEAITSSLMGIPNVFVSREGVGREAAVLGDGFYTMLGKRGLWDTGLTIRFKVDPKARKDTDFLVFGDYIVFLNRNALQVVPESLRLSSFDFLKTLVDQKFDHSDLGLLMRFRRRVQASGADETLTQQQDVEAEHMIDRLFRMEKSGPYLRLLKNGERPSDLVKVIPALKKAYDRAQMTDALATGSHADLVEVAGKALGMGVGKEVILELISKADPVALKALLALNFSKPESFELREELDLILKHPSANENVWSAAAEFVFSTPFHSDKLDMLVNLLEGHYSERLAMSVAEFVLPTFPEPAATVKLLDRLIKEGTRSVRLTLIQKFFSKVESEPYAAQVQALIDTQDVFVLRSLAQFHFVHPFAVGNEPLLSRLKAARDPVVNLTLRRNCAAAIRTVAAK